MIFIFLPPWPYTRYPTLWSFSSHRTRPVTCTTTSFFPLIFLVAKKTIHSLDWASSFNTSALKAGNTHEAHPWVFWVSLLSSERSEPLTACSSCGGGTIGPKLAALAGFRRPVRRPGNAIGQPLVERNFRCIPPPPSLRNVFVWLRVCVFGVHLHFLISSHIW